MSAPPLPSPEDKSGSAVRGMFSRIAPRYDLLNRTLSGGLDVAWRRKAAAWLDPRPGERILDVGAGTGDLALSVLARSGGRARVVAADFTFEMLALSRRKRRARPVSEAGADGLRLPFPDASFAGATAAFSVRNFESLDAGLREVWRVLAPGGRFVFLEHVAAEGRPRRLKWQRRIEPLWKRAAGNCHLTRNTEQAIAAAGFSIERIARESLCKVPAVVRPTIRGIAVKEGSVMRVA